MSTVDPLQAALGGDDADPSGTEDAGNGNAGIDHPVLSRFGSGPEAVRKALDAYQELDRSFGQEGHRLGQTVAQLQDQIAELQAQQQEPDAGYEPPQMPPSYEYNQLQEAYEQDPVATMTYLISQGQMMMADQLKAEMDERLKPLEVNVGRSTSQTLVDGLNRAVGAERVARNQDALEALAKSDPDFYKGDPQLVLQRMKIAVLAADSEKGNQRGASNGASTSRDVEVMGGSQGRNPQATDGELDPAEEFLKEMNSVVTERDAFGNPKR